MQEFLIVNPSQMDICYDLVKREGWQWSFMGTDPCLRESIIDRLGANSRYYYAKELKQVCMEQKKIFLDWIAEVGRRQNKFWWATNMAYKNPYASDIFLNFCLLALIKKWNDTGVKKRLVIVENPWLIRSCSENFEKNSVNVIDDKIYFRKAWLLHHLASIKQIYTFLKRASRMFLTNKVYAFFYRERIAKIQADNYDVLFCTWIEGRSFKGEDNKFLDPYLGSLGEYCSRIGLKAITTTLPVFPFNLLKKSYKSGAVIPLISYARLLDFFKAFMKALFLKFNYNTPRSNDVNLDAIFEYESIREKGYFFEPYLLYLISLNLFRKQKISFHYLLYPFENQPWDKMMVLANKESRSKYKMVACHNIGVPFFFLNYFLGENESHIQPQPDIIVSNGEYWGQILKAAGFSCTIKSGGSLRFGVGKKPDKEEAPKKESDDREDNVLVLLSTSLEYSLDLVFYMLRNPRGDKMFLIKPHPDMPEEVIKKYVEYFPDNFVFVGGTMDEWMDKVGWAIHIGTTAAVECMMKGIKVFKYLPERIDLDPILGLGINQPEVGDNDVIPFETAQTLDAPDNSLIAEPFNEKTWNEILIRS